MAGTATLTAWRDVDLARVRLLADGKDGFKRSWIMLMPEGDFEHPQYGTLAFSRSKLAEFKKNFDGRVRHIDIALDQDHDGGKATGWLEQLALKADGLWGLVRWTPLGQQLLSDQIYRYFSPEFGKFTDPESGKTFSNVIIGGALTNRPFLKNMPAVQLKAKFERPGQYTKSDREKISAEDFAGPNKTFPIVTQQDVHDAARLIGHAANPAAVKARIKAIAKRKGFSLPASWEDGADESSSAASERNAAVATRKQSRKLADPEPEEESDEQDQEFGETDETDDALDVVGEEGAEELDEGDADEDEGQTFADKKPAFKGAAKPFGKGGKDGKKPANDAEDAADGGADEDEELDDMTSDDEEYDDDDANTNAEDDGEDEEEVPAPKGRAAGKGKGKGMPTATKKMTEPQLLAENARLREENKTLREEQFKLGVSKKLSEFTRNIRKDGEDAEFALPRSFKLAYQEFMFEHGIRASESSLTKLNDLVEKALRLGTVPLTSLANQIDDGRVQDNDDRRPRESRDTMDQTPDAEKIALSEHHMTIAELAVAKPDLARSIYLRLEKARTRREQPAA